MSDNEMIGQSAESKESMTESVTSPEAEGSMTGSVKSEGAEGSMTGSVKSQGAEGNMTGSVKSPGAEGNMTEGVKSSEAEGSMTKGVKYSEAEESMTGSVKSLGAEESMTGSVKSPEAEGNMTEGVKSPGAEGNMTEGIKSPEAEGSMTECVKSPEAEGSMTEGIKSLEAEGNMTEGVKSPGAEGNMTEGVKSPEEEGNMTENVKSPEAKGSMTEGVKSPGAEESMTEGVKSPEAEGSMTEGIKSLEAEGNMTEDVKSPGAEGNMTEGVKSPGAEGNMTEGVKSPGAEGSTTGSVKSSETEGSLTGSVKSFETEGNMIGSVKPFETEGNMTRSVKSFETEGSMTGSVKSPETEGSMTGSVNLFETGGNMTKSVKSFETEGNMIGSVKPFETEGSMTGSVKYFETERNMTGSVKSPEAVGNAKKEVDKLRLQVHGLWIVMVILTAIIVGQFVYPQKNCSGSNDKIEDIRKQHDEVGDKMGRNGEINVEEKSCIYDRLDKIDEALKDQLETVHKNISSMTVIILSNITGLVSEHNQTKTLCYSLTSNVIALNAGLKDLKVEFNNNLTDINDVLEKRLTRIEKQLDIFDKTMPTIVLNLSGAQNEVKELVTNFSKLNASVDTLGQTFTKELVKTFESLDNTIKQITNESSANHSLVMEEFKVFMDKSKNLSEDLMKIDNASKKGNDLLEKTTKVTSLLRSHALNKTNVLIVVSVIFFLLFAQAFWIYNLHNKINNKSGTNIMTRKEVSQKLSRPSRLESSICLISFNKYMSTFQQNLIKEVLGNIPVTTTVISSHSQLLELPHCRLYVMCIEFSERHVIIEKPGLGLGDLKKTTHDVIKELSGDLIMIYTRDPGSRLLPQGQLYNNNIYCVSSQPELTALRNLNRFYSIYDKFTDYQIDTLITTVDNCLEK